MTNPAPFHIFKERECRNCKGTGELEYVAMCDPEDADGEPVCCPECMGSGAEPEDYGDELT